MKKNNISTDILVIGAGPAGLTAALYGARAGKKTTVLESVVCGGQITSTGEIENMPGFATISGPDLAISMMTQAESAGAEIVYTEIKEIEFSPHKVIANDGTSYDAKSIIIATGAGPRRLDCDGAALFDGRNIHYCGLCDGNFYKDKDVAVVGGGNSAVEEVIYLAEIVKSVTIVNITDKFNAQKPSLDKLVTLKNIKAIYHNHVVTRVSGDKNLTAIEIQDTKSKKITAINCDGIFVAIGRAPNTDIIKDKIELNKCGYIKVDANMQTNVQGVFAAGDVVDKALRQIVTACADGAIAAVSASQC